MFKISTYSGATPENVKKLELHLGVGARVAFYHIVEDFDEPRESVIDNLLQYYSLLTHGRDESVWVLKRTLESDCSEGGELFGFLATRRNSLIACDCSMEHSEATVQTLWV